MSAIEQKQFELPPFYRESTGGFKKVAQRLDSEYRHRWVKVGAENEIDRASKGWVPCEDKATLVKLGLGSLVAANGRARSGDLELWRMPVEQARLIRKYLDGKTAEKSTMLKQQLDAMQLETIGRTAGKVVPTFTYGPATDVLERQPLVMPKTGAVASKE